MRTLFFCTLTCGTLSLMHSQTKQDSLKFFEYYNKAYKLRNSHPDSALYWIEQCVQLPITPKNEWLAKAYNLRGIIYYKKSNYAHSILDLEKALKLTNDKELQGKIYINMGNTLSDLRYHYSAIHYYEKAVQIFNDIQNYQFLVRALMNLASEEFNIQQKNIARTHLKLALYYAHEHDMIEEEAMCLNNLSAMFIQSGLIDSASRYIYQSFHKYEQLENYFGLADAYLTAIELHLEKKETEYARTLIDIADSIIDHLKYLEGKKIITSEKVNYYLLVQDISHAQKYFNIYLRLEDSLNKIKSETKNISLQNSTTDTSEQKDATNKNRWAILQVVLILLIAVWTSYGIIKNYRYGET